LICLKPAVDAWRVASNEDKDPDLLVDAELEMVFSRGVEIVFESLPALTMQLVALMKAEQKDLFAVVSIVISASTVAFVGTSISWDLDTSPTKRKGNPDFYGYIKNDPTSRTFSFVAIFTLTLSHVLMKTIATALLVILSGTWAAIYMACDMAFFMLLKIVRSDFRYWLNLPDPFSLIASFIMRFCGKLLVDYTLNLHLRHPFEAGGVLFLGLIVQNQAACFVAAVLYFKYYQEAEIVVDIIHNNSTSTTDIFKIINATDIIWSIVDLNNFTNTADIIDLSNTTVTTFTNTKIEGGMLWPGLIGLLALNILSAATLAYWVDKKYLHTFTSTETGPHYLALQYHAATTDEQRVGAFNKHPSYYCDFKDDLKEFVVGNWADWMANRPDWLTDDLIGYIGDEYIPPAEVGRLNEVGGGKRRRSSAFGVEAGGGERRKSSVLGVDIGVGGGRRSKVAPINE